MAALRYLENVVTLKLDVETCVGCGTCLEVCPHTVFELADGKAGIRDRDACMECGACAMNCPVEAVSVRSAVGCAAGVIFSKLGIGSAECACQPEELIATECCPENPDARRSQDKRAAPAKGGGGSCCG